MHNPYRGQCAPQRPRTALNAATLLLRKTSVKVIHPTIIFRYETTLGVPRFQRSGLPGREDIEGEMRRSMSAGLQ
jgi:hypothetical protein